MLNPTLQIRKQRQKGFNCLMQAFKSRQRQSQSLKPSYLYLEPLKYSDAAAAAAAATAAAKLLQSCLTVRPRRQQSTRLLCAWDSPGENTGVGCHFLL